jgi:hypothetical protein
VPYGTFYRPGQKVITRILEIANAYHPLNGSCLYSLSPSARKRGRPWHGYSGFGADKKHAQTSHLPAPTATSPTTTKQRPSRNQKLRDNSPSESRTFNILVGRQTPGATSRSRPQLSKRNLTNLVPETPAPPHLLTWTKLVFPHHRLTRPLDKRISSSDRSTAADLSSFPPPAATNEWPRCR